MESKGQREAAHATILALEFHTADLKELEGNLIYLYMYTHILQTLEENTKDIVLLYEADTHQVRLDHNGNSQCQWLQ